MPRTAVHVCQLVNTQGGTNIVEPSDRGSDVVARCCLSTSQDPGQGKQWDCKAFALVTCFEAFWVWIKLAPLCFMLRTEENYQFLVAFTKEKEVEFITDPSMYLAHAIVKPTLLLYCNETGSFLNMPRWVGPSEIKQSEKILLDFIFREG